MAGSVEHLAVAWELIQHWKEQDSIRLEDPALFLVGTICPDGIHSRDNYQRPMKMHTHFRDGIADYEFSKLENLQLFHSRIKQFAQDTFSGKVQNTDLNLGYIVHLLTDEYFMRTVRPEFMKEIAGLGLHERTEETFRHFSYDVNQINYRLAREYPGMKWVYRTLKKSEPYEVRGMLTEEELTRSREWILHFFFEDAPEPDKPRFLTYERTLEFIQDAVRFIDIVLPEYIGRKHHIYNLSVV